VHKIVIILRIFPLIVIGIVRLNIPFISRYLYGPEPTFIVWAPPYTHRSSGIRALYRLCHHLNVGGYSAAMHGVGITPDNWLTPFYNGKIDKSIVIYPEIVSGNPLKAKKVVRWVLNDPGLLGGDSFYNPDEIVFVYDAQKLSIASIAANQDLGPERVLWIGLIDPNYIYEDKDIKKTMITTFKNKGLKLSRRYPLPENLIAEPIENITPDLSSLGHVLRKTKTLYSYDHYSNILREAFISGCEVKVIGEDGEWHDPKLCKCKLNINWDPNLIKNYAKLFHERNFLDPFIAELKAKWSKLNF
jgi:hypothetical protein